MQAGDDCDPEEDPGEDGEDEDEEEDEILGQWEKYSFDLGFQAGMEGFQEAEEPDESQTLSDALGAFDEKARKERNEERRERLEEALAIHAHYVIDVTKYVVPFTILVLVWHFTLPEWLGWLTKEQKSGLTGFLIGGAGLGIISTIFVYFRNLILSRK